MIFHHLGEPTVRIGNVTDPPTVQITRGVPLHLLDLHLLDLDLDLLDLVDLLVLLDLLDLLNTDIGNPLATDLKR